MSTQTLRPPSHVPGSATTLKKPSVIDVFHPFTSLKWSQCCKLPESMLQAQAVWLKDRLYVGGGTTPLSFKDDAKVYTYTPNIDTWDAVDTPVYWFAIVSYNSQLVLVGGVEYVNELGDGQSTNKLLTLRDDNQWQEILPPMNTKRHSASAASHGDHILVAGGATFDLLDVVEMLTCGGSCWILVKPLPFPCQKMECTTFNGCWYLLGGPEGRTVWCASLDSLIANKTLYEWKTLPSVPDSHCSLAAFGNRLVVVEKESKSAPSSAILAYSPHTESWVHVGDIPPTGESSVYTISMPEGGLNVIGSDAHFIVDLNETSFMLENCFTLRALHQLEGANIPILASLNDNFKAFSRIINADGDPTLDSVLDSWLMGMSCIRPTWKNLFLVLCLLGLDSMGQQIDIYVGRINEQQYEGDNEQFIITKGDAQFTLMQDAAIAGLKQKNVLLTEENESLRLQLEKSLLLQQQEGISKLRGIEVHGEKTVVVYSSHAQQITMEGFGLKLHIHEGSLPAGMEQCILQIKASLAGQYEFPENSHLVSAIFWLRCETVQKFTKPIAVEIQHCAKSENLSKLSFVRGVCSRKQLPYTFKQLPGGNFTSHSSYGVIELNSFSGVGITQEGSEERNYLANLLFKEVKGRHTVIILEIFFVIICNTDAHRTIMNNHTRFKDAQLETDQPIEFEDDQVEFRLSKPNRKWKITRLNSAVVRREDVDSFTYSETSWVPHSHFRAKFQGDISSITDLECDVDVVGAKHPHNKFAIDISPEGPMSPSWMMPLTPPAAVAIDSAVDSNRLTDQHHGVLVEQLSHHTALWREIGGKLHFTQGELNNIQTNMLLSAGSPGSWLGAMLSQWLQWAPGDARGSTSFATLDALKDALRQANLGATAHDLHS